LEFKARQVHPASVPAVEWARRAWRPPRARRAPADGSRWWVQCCHGDPAAGSEVVGEC